MFRPTVLEEDATDEEVIDDDCELILEKVEEEMLADYASDDENDDVLLKVDDLNREFKVWYIENNLIENEVVICLLIFPIRWKGVNLHKKKIFWNLI